MISVVVPAYRAPALERCVQRLLEQRLENEPVEVIVCVSADTADELPRLDSHPRLRVLTHVPRLSAAAARNRAAACSQGRLIAFTDADAIADQDWLARLVEASADRYCTAGSVRNGTPESAAGTAEYVVEFLDLHPGRSPQTVWHGATVNLLLPRELWLELGPFPEDLDGGEDTLLTVQARRQGRFRFAGSAMVTHENRTSWAHVLRHQLEFGRFNARLARRSPLRGGFALRNPLLVPLAFVGRAVSLYVRIAKLDPALAARAVRLLPGVLALLAAWAAGLLLEQLRPGGCRLVASVRGSRRGSRRRDSGD